MKKLIAIFVVVFLACSTAFAGGDKNRKASPVISPGDEACIYEPPVGIETKDEDCELQEGTSTSGYEVFLCTEELVVLCTE